MVLTSGNIYVWRRMSSGMWCHVGCQHMAILAKPTASNPRLSKLTLPTFYGTWRIIRTSAIVWDGRIQSYFFTIHFSLPHLCYMPHSSHPPWFCHPNNVWWQAQIIYASIFTIHHFFLSGTSISLGITCLHEV